MAPVDTLPIVNRIGNVGDLTSDLTETIIMGILSVFLITVKKGWVNIYFIIYYLSTFLGLINIMVTIIIFVIYRRQKLLKLRGLDIHNIKIQPSISASANTSNTASNHDLSSTHILVEPKKGCNGLSYIRYLINAFKQFYGNKIVFHAMWHCILLNMYISLIQYPIAYSEITDFIKVNETTTIANFCGAEIVNLILMGAITNLSYLCGSIFYGIFIVNAHVVTFYRIWYPVACVIVTACTITLIYDIPIYIAIILLSVSQIIPYYLTYYDYYLFTEYADSDSYGFILGVYGVSTTLVTILMQLLYIIDMSYTILISIAIIVLILSFIYSYYLAYLYKKYNSDSALQLRAP